jgi:hypothetical protein
MAKMIHDRRAHLPRSGNQAFLVLHKSWLWIAFFAKI